MACSTTRRWSRREPRSATRAAVVTTTTTIRGVCPVGVIWDVPMLRKKWCDDGNGLNMIPASAWPLQCH